MSESDVQPETAQDPPAVAAVLAEFDGPDALVAAAARIRDETFELFTQILEFP